MAKHTSYSSTTPFAMPTGYTDVSFSGEGVTDALLQIVAAKSGSKFERVKIQSSSNVTDVGLFAVIDKASNLQHISVEELPSVITGGCLGSVQSQWHVRKQLWSGMCSCDQSLFVYRSLSCSIMQRLPDKVMLVGPDCLTH